MRVRWVLVISFALDLLVFGLNFFIAILGNSKTVLSQAFFSLTDMVGNSLLLVGYYSSQRPPDASHPFGFGKDIFFWSFTATLFTFSIAGVGIFALGLKQFLIPTPITHISLSLLMLGFTVLINVLGLSVIMMERVTRLDELTHFIAYAQQGLKTIFFQDVLAVVGACGALVGLFVVDLTQNFALDGLTAMGIGGMLVGTGVFLAAESRQLLVGKAISLDMARIILSIIEREPQVRKVRELQSMLLGPADALVALRINFANELTTDELEQVIDRLSFRIKDSFPDIRHVIIEPES